MQKEFLPFNIVRNNGLKLAHKIYNDGFIPDVIYASLRGGAYMANIISEYFKLRSKNVRPVLFSAVVARSYTDVREKSRVMVDGWTYSPEYLRNGDKILLVDDIFDTGNTLNHLVNILLERGVPRNDIKIVVHDYKYFPNKKDQHPNQPDYWCRKLEITNPEDDKWIHYMSHELVGLSKKEFEEQYCIDDPELRDIVCPLLEN